MQGFSIHVHTNPIDGYGRGVIQQHKAPQMQLISQPPSNQQNISQGTKFIKNFVIDYSKKIGQGNFSCVYTAIDQRQPNQRLAVKVVNMQQLRQQSL